MVILGVFLPLQAGAAWLTTPATFFWYSGAAERCASAGVECPIGRADAWRVGACHRRAACDRRRVPGRVDGPLPPQPADPRLKEQVYLALVSQGFQNAPTPTLPQLWGRECATPLSLILGEGLGERAIADSPHPNPPPTLGEGVCHSPLPDFWERGRGRGLHPNPTSTPCERARHPPLPDCWQRGRERGPQTAPTLAPTPTLPQF